MRQVHLPPMVIARIEITDPLLDPEPLALILPIAEGYGHTADVAHRFLTLALTAASHPVVIDSVGNFHHVPPDLLRRIATWDVPPQESIRFQ